MNDFECPARLDRKIEKGGVVRVLLLRVNDIITCAARKSISGDMDLNKNERTAWAQSKISQNNDIVYLEWKSACKYNGGGI